MSTDTFLSWYTVIDSFLPLSFWVSVIVPLRSEVVGFSLTVAEFVPALIQDTLAEADPPADIAAGGFAAVGVCDLL